MNLSPAWIDVLAADGHDVVHWRDIGRADCGDEEIIAVAARDGRAVMTADLDFGASVARRGLTTPNVVQLRLSNTDPLVVGGVVRASLKSAESALSGGAILTISSGRSRMRAAVRQSIERDDS